MNAERAKLEATLGAPVFLIAEDYGLAGELCHYLPPRPPEAPGHPACYVEDSPVPSNQFHFWPRYSTIEARTTPIINDQEDSSQYGVSPFAGHTALYVTARDEKSRRISSWIPSRNGNSRRM